MARRTIFISLISNILFVTGLWATSLLPGLEKWELNASYSTFVGSIIAVLFASSSAYLISENINSMILCKIKELTNSRYLFIRVIISNVIASAIDSIIFARWPFIIFLALTLSKL